MKTNLNKIAVTPQGYIHSFLSPDISSQIYTLQSRQNDTLKSHLLSFQVSEVKL